jgi:hypothetical protein
MSDSLTSLELSRIMFALDRGESPELTREQAYALAAHIRGVGNAKVKRLVQLRDSATDAAFAAQTVADIVRELESA